MALPVVKTPNDFPFKHTGQPDKLGQSLGGDYAKVQDLFDSRAVYNQDQINAIINELKSTTLNDDGAKNIGLKLSQITATEVNGAILELYNAIAGIVLGQIPDNSLTNLKLAPDVKVGSLALLSTTEKSNLVAAINEVISEVLHLTGGDLTGELRMARNLLTRPLIKDYTEKVVVISAATGTVNLDFASGNVFDITLTGNAILTFINIPASEAHSVTLIIRQGGTAYSLTLPASVKFSGDTLPTISDINKTSLYTLVTVNGGTRYYASASTKFTT